MVGVTTESGRIMFESAAELFFSASITFDQRAASFPNFNINAAADLTQESSAITVKTVGVFSTTRRIRYHQEVMICLAFCPDKSAISRATNPKPPPCNK